MDFRGFVLAASTADLSEEPLARRHADAVEFRMDLAEEPLAALDEYDGDLPVIATNRAEWEGGAAEEDGRLDALVAAAEYDAVEAVDVELRSLQGREGERAAERAREDGNDAAVIASVHHFDDTPDYDDLRGLVSRAATYGDVGKVAVTATDAGDVLDLLCVTHEATRAGEVVATMAMGEAGRHSRAVAPLYGSRVGYAPVDAAAATAPGQYDLATLASLLERLGVER